MFYKNNGGEAGSNAKTAAAPEHVQQHNAPTPRPVQAPLYRRTQTPKSLHSRCCPRRHICPCDRHPHTQEHKHIPTPAHTCGSATQTRPRRPNTRLPGWTTRLRGFPAPNCGLPTHPQRSRRSAALPIPTEARTKRCQRHGGRATNMPDYGSAIHLAC